MWGERESDGRKQLSGRAKARIPRKRIKPDRLELLAVAVILGERRRGKGPLRAGDGGGGSGFLLLQRVELIDRLSLHRLGAVVVTYAILFLSMRLDLWQAFPCGLRAPVREAEVPAARHANNLLLSAS